MPASDCLTFDNPCWMRPTSAILSLILAESVFLWRTVCEKGLWREIHLLEQSDVTRIRMVFVQRFYGLYEKQASGFFGRRFLQPCECVISIVQLSVRIGNAGRIDIPAF